MTQSLTTMLKEFHDTYNVPSKDATNVADTFDWLQFRDKIFSEEYVELITASIKYAQQGVSQEERQKELTEVLDALADMIYVAAGTAQLLGFDIQGALEEVHASNMSKLGEDGLPIIADGSDPDKPKGKVLKGPNFREPHLRPFMPEITEFNEEVNKVEESS